MPPRRRAVLTPAARADLRSIAAYVRAEDPVAAARLLRAKRAAIARLAALPAIGHVREDLTHEPLRFWPVYSYLIVYRPDARPVEVVRVLHGARDVERILFQE